MVKSARLQQQSNQLPSASKTFQKPKARMLKPIVFIDVDTQEQRSQDGHSYYNDGEVNVVRQVLKVLCDSLGVPGMNIGVITFYKAQVVTAAEQLKSFQQNG